MPYKPIKTTCLEIVDYWNSNANEADMGVDWADSIIDKSKKIKLSDANGNKQEDFVCVNDLLKEQGLVCDDKTPDWSRLKELKIDSKNLRFRCWRCASTEKSIERCHIQARQFGGTDEPSNLVLLCHECHAEAPDIKNDKESMWEWIKATKKPFYKTYLAYQSLDEFRKIYGYDLCSDESPIMKKISNARNKDKVINNFVKDLDKIVREESGVHGFGISPSTVAILINKLIKKSC